MPWEEKGEAQCTLIQQNSNAIDNSSEYVKPSNGTSSEVSQTL